MVNAEHLCSHKNIIDDEREGSCVCTECGLVLEQQLFLPNLKNDYSKIRENENENETEIKELLHRIHLPYSYSEKITKKCFKKPKKSIPYILYKTLNENGCHVSIKQISAVSGVSNSKIYKNQGNEDVVISKPEEMLEKYCNYLGLDFNSYTVIKEKIKKTLKTGHNPLTIVAGNIYLHTKEKGIKVSMKHIARQLNISCISIQRYLKK